MDVVEEQGQGCYQSEWTRVCCTNKQFQKLSGFKQPKVISHSCHTSVRSRWGLCSMSPHFGWQIQMSRMSDQWLSETMPVITGRWKESSWRVSCWYLNVLAQKYHKSLLLTSHWLELVTWPQLTLGVLLPVPSCYSRNGGASISKARLSQKPPQIPLWPEAGPTVPPSNRGI